MITSTCPESEIETHRFCTLSKNHLYEELTIVYLGYFEKAQEIMSSIYINFEKSEKMCLYIPSLYNLLFQDGIHNKSSNFSF